MSRQATPAGARASGRRQSIGSGSGLTAALEHIIEEQYPDMRDIKRPAVSQVVNEPTMPSQALVEVK